MMKKNFLICWVFLLLLLGGCMQNPSPELPKLYSAQEKRDWYMTMANPIYLSCGAQGYRDTHYCAQQNTYFGEKAGRFQWGTGVLSQEQVHIAYDNHLVISMLEFGGNTRNSQTSIVAKRGDVEIKLHGADVTCTPQMIAVGKCVSGKVYADQYYVLKAWESLTIERSDFLPLFGRLDDDVSFDVEVRSIGWDAEIAYEVDFRDDEG